MSDYLLTKTCNEGDTALIIGDQCGTLALTALASGVHAVVVTADSERAQLISTHLRYGKRCCGTTAHIAAAAWLLTLLHACKEHCGFVFGWGDSAAVDFPEYMHYRVLTRVILRHRDTTSAAFASLVRAAEDRRKAKLLAMYVPSSFPFVSCWANADNHIST